MYLVLNDHWPSQECRARVRAQNPRSEHSGLGGVRKASEITEKWERSRWHLMVTKILRMKKIKEHSSVQTLHFTFETSFHGTKSFFQVYCHNYLISIYHRRSRFKVTMLVFFRFFEACDRNEEEWSWDSGIERLLTRDFCPQTEKNTKVVRLKAT